jgi:hypothetical protein
MDQVSHRNDIQDFPQLKTLIPQAGRMAWLCSLMLVTSNIGTIERARRGFWDNFWGIISHTTPVEKGEQKEVVVVVENHENGSAREKSTV